MSANFLPKNPKNADPVVVGGLTPLTTIDYPGQLAAVLFLQGCPWRCAYCHNRHLMNRQQPGTMAWRQLLDFLERRRGLLDAVVFSGGEPTLHARLGEAMAQLRGLGYRVGLHTAGIYPERLRRLLPLLDWVGLDIKAAKSDYERITGVKGSGERAWQSAAVIAASKVACEIRTTVHPDLLDTDAVTALAAELKNLGVENYVIQECITQHCYAPACRRPSAKRIDSTVLRQLGKDFPGFGLRQA